MSFTKFEQSVHESYGDRIAWLFTVEDGPHNGSVTSRYTGAKLTPKSAFMKVIVRGMLGRALQPGEQFDPDKLIGKRFLAVVGETDSGATRIESLMPTTDPGDTPF